MQDLSFSYDQETVNGESKCDAGHAHPVRGFPGAGTLRLRSPELTSDQLAPFIGKSSGVSNPYAPNFSPDSYAGMPDMADQYLSPSVYGSENIMSYPVTADPSFSATDYFPAYTAMQEDLPLPQQPSAYMTGAQADPMAWDVPMPSDLSTISHPASDNWSLDMLSMGTNIPPPGTTCPSYVSVPSPCELSCPSTPDFLPIQQFEDPFQPTESKKTKGEEELVGMGLYSQPNGTLARAPQSKSGKGLKLEETFTPSEEDKDEADAEAEEVQQFQPPPPSYAENAPTIRPSKQQPRQPLNLLQRSFFFDHDEADQQPMAAQPFTTFNQPCMNYGYGWF
ncbi:uncharacterized protein N7515_009375 [Penicillium bovifimosum]|uniref:Uncharacterized protein n=1 Tax=Penicillium bovifimosum TaxID=126998 RepID=A0A9W9GJE7_9EURO|nr:uncharacterized protein N7515_009375 [Penicillium bovifimosum]KAJ5121414.1 hypothetical protein N7515_009375 [Penicillium bovifimosum]